MKEKIGQFFIRAVFICCFFVLIVACGYSFAPQGDYIDKRIQKIYVEQFSNKPLKPK